MKNKKKDWTQNIISYSTTGNAGLCPFCHSSDLDVQTLDIGRQSLNIRCNSCGKFAHIDGAPLEATKPTKAK